MDVFEVKNPELAQAIEWAKESIETTITTALVDVAEQRSMWADMPAKLHPIDDVLFTVKEDTHVELTNLKLVKEPDFHFTNLAARFEHLFFEANLNVGDLEVNGDFFVTNNSLNTVLPLAVSGQISVTFKNVKGEGSIGVYPEGDCFLTNNYALEYKPEKVLVKTTYDNSEDRVNSELEGVNIDETLGAHLWVNLTHSVNELLKRELDEDLFGLSACDLLQGQSELVDSIIEHRKVVYGVTNGIFDKIIADFNSKINELKLATIPIANIDASFAKKLGSVVTTGRFAATNGIFQNLATLGRKGDISVAMESGKFVIFGKLKLNEFKIAYDNYTAKLTDTSATGTIKATVDRNEALLKFVLDTREQSVKIRLVDFKITDISDIEADVTNLGELSWLHAKISSWTTSTLRLKVAPVVETNVKEIVNKVIENFDVNALLKN